ncbi:MAG: hypothetical protein II001_07095, partial [Bacteroidales bacterium]|nr:hypothetical protein [Bacteroidales bacterium]
MEQIMMKTPSKLIRRLEYVLAALVILLGCGSAVAQPVKVGDLLTFNDGTKGVVCYVDPGNNQKGWVVALSPLTDKKSFKNVAYDHLYSYNSSDLKMNGTVSSAPHGKVNTHILANNDDELDDLLLSAGSITWYIPDAIQMMRIVGQYPILQHAALQAGGDLSDLITYDRSFWTSSKVSSENKLYCLTDPTTSNNSKIIVPANPSDEKFLFLVRDFDNGNEPSACWKFGDNCLASKIVAPSNDTTFMGLIRYRDFIDTIYGNMAVILPIRDTLPEYIIPEFLVESGEYTAGGVTFTGITAPGTYYHNDTLNTANGCDSIVTKVLEVTTPITHMDIAIVKYWSWWDAPAEERPLSITLGLFTSDTLVQEVIITGPITGQYSDEWGEWHDTLRNIPIYNDLNEVIVYEMREKSVNGEWLKEAGNTWYNSHYILRDIGYDEPNWMSPLPQFYFDNMYFSTDPDTTFVLCTDDEHATAYITHEFDDWETSSIVTDTLWTITLTPEGEVSINTYDLQHIREMFSYIDGAEVIGVKNYDPKTDLWTLMYKEITSGEYLWSDNLIHRIRVKTHLQTHDTSVVIVDILHDGYLWHDSLYKEPGHHTVYTHKANGCPLSDNLNLEVLHVEVSGGDICAGDSTDLLVSVSKMGNSSNLHAYWAIQPEEDSIRVSPADTTVYDALVIYNTDTFTVQQTVNVYPIEKITLYDTVNYAGVAYDTTIFDLYSFHVTGPGNDTLNAPLQTHLGCDSIVTVV